MALTYTQKDCLCCC